MTESFLASAIGRSGAVLNAPTTDGSAGQVLVTDGSGSLSFSNPSTLAASPMLELAVGNTADLIDFGFYGNYTSSGAKYSGLFRDATDGKFKLFTGLQEEPSTTVNTAGTGYTAGTLVVGTLETSGPVSITPGASPSQPSLTITAPGGYNSLKWLATGGKAGYLYSDATDVLIYTDANSNMRLMTGPSNSNTFLYAIGSNQRVGLGPNVSSPGGQVHVVSGGATTVGLIVEGYAAQSGNYFECNTMGTTGGTSFAINSDGNLVVPHEFVISTTSGKIHLSAWTGSVTFGNKIGVVASGTTLRLDNSSRLVWSSLVNNLADGFDDIGLFRNASGVLEVNNGTAGTYRDLILQNLTSTGRIYAANGSGTAPSIGFTNSSAGFFRDGAHGMTFTANSAPGMYFTQAQILAAANFQLDWLDSVNAVTGTVNVGIKRHADGVIRLTNGSTGSGKLLIGPSTTTIGAQLHVVSSGSTVVGTRIDGATYHSAALLQLNMTGTPSGNAFEINLPGGSGGNALVVTAAGNVGIGITPLWNFDFVGRQRITTVDGTDGTLRIATTVGEWFDFEIHGGALRLYDGNSIAMEVFNAGIAIGGSIYGGFALEIPNNGKMLIRGGNIIHRTANNDIENYMIEPLSSVSWTGNGVMIGSSSSYQTSRRELIILGGCIGIGQTSFGTNAVTVLAHANGTAPTTSPVDCYQLYSNDQVAGNACPHIRTENGAIIKIYQETNIIDADGTLADLTTKFNSLLTKLETIGLLAAA